MFSFLFFSVCVCVIFFVCFVLLFFFLFILVVVVSHSIRSIQFWYHCIHQAIQILLWKVDSQPLCLVIRCLIPPEFQQSDRFFFKSPLFTFALLGRVFFSLCVCVCVQWLKTETKFVAFFLVSFFFILSSLLRHF